jgi:hypothetical protein
MPIYKTNNSGRNAKKVIERVKNKYPRLNITVHNAETFLYCPSDRRKIPETEIVRYDFEIKFGGKKPIRTISESEVAFGAGSINQRVMCSPFGECEYSDPEGGSTEFKSEFIFKNKIIKQYFNNLKEISIFIDVMVEFDRMDRYPDTDCAAQSIIHHFSGKKTGFFCCDCDEFEENYWSYGCKQKGEADERNPKDDVEIPPGSYKFYIKGNPVGIRYYRDDENECSSSDEEEA